MGGVFAEIFVRQRLIVAGDAAATAQNILTHERLFRWGFAAELVPCLCNMPLAVIFYELFKVVNRRAALTFFGGYCLTIGYLIFRSTFLPRVIGVLLAIEGVCYLTNSFVDFLAPGLASGALALLMVSGLAEVVLCLWLLLKGLNLAKWQEMAAS